ncbi:MAG: hypothetical protein AAGA92_06545 [Planctomycetota bacterium]
MNDKPHITDDALDGLLRSAVAAQTAPPSLRNSVRSAVAREQSNGSRRLAVAAAAACVALGWIAIADRYDQSAPTSVAPQTPEVVVVEPPTEFTTSNHIVVRHERVAPNVTVVQLVPTYESEKRVRREALARSIRNRVAQRGGAS